jgi:hypothetical protein
MCRGGRRHVIFLAEGQQQPFIAQEVIKHPAEEFGLAGTRLEIGGTDSGQGKESTQPLRVFGQKGQRMQG